MTQQTIHIVGAGLAGCECALALARQGLAVSLYEQKPNQMSPAHHTGTFGEIVCSNSLKNKSPLSASGLLKEELKSLGSSLLNIAEQCAVPAGAALAVDREQFTQLVTQAIKSNPNITLHENCEITKPFGEGITVFATGPLTSPTLEQNIQQMLGTNNLHFFDASAPIVEAESINMQNAYFLGRYGKDQDYLNCPLSKEEYETFYNEIINAKRVTLKEFEKGDVFEGCMPIEVLASRGKDAMRFGPLKPRGLIDPKTGKEPYACLQLRKENMQANSYGLVGFQTNLTFPEQKRVFSLIPALKNATYIKYGVMHRNTFLCAPQVFDKYFNLRQNKNIYFAGQITGVEGYVESMASGMVVAMQIVANQMGKKLTLPNTTCIGALAEYVHIPQKNFQPMNANYGIMPDISRQNLPKKPTKEQKAEYRFEESTKQINQLKEELKWI